MSSGRHCWGSSGSWRHASQPCSRWGRGQGGCQGQMALGRGAPCAGPGSSAAHLRAASPTATAPARTCTATHHAPFCCGALLAHLQAEAQVYAAHREVAAQRDALGQSGQQRADEAGRTAQQLEARAAELAAREARLGIEEEGLAAQQRVGGGAGGGGVRQAGMRVC
jgi:hypothetical protein